MSNGNGSHETRIGAAYIWRECKSTKLARYTIPKKKEKMVAKKIIIMSAVEISLRSSTNTRFMMKSS